MGLKIRPIEPTDNLVIAEVIKTVFREFKIDKPGTVYSDPSTDFLNELFQTPESGYWIALEGEQIIGGCGFYPTAGLPKKCAELVKFYLSAVARGKGIGKELMDKVSNSAKEHGYEQLYLESFPELVTAVGMYKKAGFIALEKPMGKSGHFACNIWMIKQLTD